MANVSFSSGSFTAINTKTQKLEIYSTTDTSWNVMKFTIQNNTGADLQLKGGTPVNGTQPGGVSSFAFDFRAILTNAQAQVMGVKDTQGLWQGLFFPGSAQTNPIWAVAPIQDLLLKNGDKVEFKLDNIACSSVTPSYFDVIYYNIPGVNVRPFPFSYLVAVLNPPVGLDLKTVLDSGVINGSITHAIGTQSPPPPGGSGQPIQVDITYDNAFQIQNAFTLYLKNNTSKPLVPPGTSLGGAIITVTFLFGTDDDNAITTQVLGDTMGVTINPAQSRWNTNAHQPTTPSWTFVPQSPELIMASETVQFPISNLITALNVNADTLSAMHVQWNFIPGYADGYYSFDMQKQAAVPAIPSFTIVPTIITYPANVQISYQTEVAAYITLGYVRRDGTTVTLVSPTDITYNEVNFAPAIAPDKESTVFTLSVYRAPGLPVVNQKTFPITVTQLPATIGFFKADRYLVDIGASGNTVTLSWSVENAKSVFIPGQGPQSGTSLLVTVNATTTYTLEVTPWGTNGQVVRQTVTVYAYKTFASISLGPIGDGTPVQTWPLAISNRARGLVYVSNAAAGSVYQVQQANKTTLPTILTGNVMTLSADEQKLFIGQSSGPGSYAIRMYDTSNVAVVSSVPAPGPPPCALAINADCTKLYYLQRNNTTAVSALSVSETLNTMTYLKDITVGNSPQPYAFVGTNLYVGNYKRIPGNPSPDNHYSTVSVIDTTQNAVTATINLTGSQPIAMALVGTKLFVACSGGNQVSVIDTTTNAVTATVIAGFQPYNLTLDQNKARLFVPNFQAATVTIINTATLATSTITVGNGPAAIKISASGKLMFVSNYCDKSLSVVDISNGGAVVVGAIQMEVSNGNPVDVSTFDAINNFTDVFVGKEYYAGRNNSCSGSKPTDANLNMSIFSIQETAPSLDEPGAIEVSYEPKPEVVPGPGPMPPPAPEHLGMWQRFVRWLRRIFGGNGK